MGVDDQNVEVGVMGTGSERRPASRRAFLAGTGAVAGVAAMAALAGGPPAARLAAPGPRSWPRVPVPSRAPA